MDKLLEQIGEKIKEMDAKDSMLTMSIAALGTVAIILAKKQN